MRKIALLLALLVMVGGVICHAEARSLIIYFDYSENIDTANLDVDAISQASIAEDERIRDRGNLLVMVDILKERTGAEVYSLSILEKYQPRFDDMVEGAQDDKDNDTQFTFAQPLPDLTDVDRIYFGSPIWWYDMPQPVINFFQRVDLSGKKIAYFSINRGSGNSGALELLEFLQPNAQVVGEYSLSAMQDNDSAAAEFNKFLDSIAG